MRKQRQKLTVRIPNFMKDSMAWRRAIHAAVLEAQDQAKVRYASDDKFDVEVRFHLQGRKLTILDIDNRLKDVLDALQDPRREHAADAAAVDGKQFLRTVTVDPVFQRHGSLPP